MGAAVGLFATAAIRSPLSSCAATAATCKYASDVLTTVVVVQAENLAIEGEPAIYRSDSGLSVFRQFCGSCGSPLFAVSEAFPGFVAIKAATLEDPSIQPWANLARRLGNFGEG